jgi:hypothetical protein
MSVISGDSALRRRWIDAVFDLYLCWREECQAVEQAYQWWTDSDRGHRALAYAGYVAAVDREEQAARAYAEQLEYVTRIGS